MASKPCARPGCDGVVTGKPYYVRLHRYCCRSCAAQMNPARQTFKAKTKTAFTDAELIAELRKRAEWTSCGSQTLLYLFAAAADRLEALMGAQKGRAA